MIDERNELIEYLNYKYRSMRKYIRLMQMFINQNKQSFPNAPSTEYIKKRKEVEYEYEF